MQHDWRRLFWLSLNRSRRMRRAIVWTGRGARLTLLMMRGGEQGMLSWLHSRTCCYCLRCEAVHIIVLALHLNVVRISDVEVRNMVLLRTPWEVG